jgi:hypothetical protein
VVVGSFLRLAAVCRPGPSFTCCLIAAVLGLSPLCHGCISVSADAPSRMSVLSGFLVPHCPGHILCDHVPVSCHSYMEGHLPAVAANFLLDPKFSQVSSSGFPWRPAAKCQPLCHLFGVLEPPNAPLRTASIPNLAPYCPNMASPFLCRPLSHFNHPSCSLSRHSFSLQWH